MLPLSAFDQFLGLFKSRSTKSSTPIGDPIPGLEKYLGGLLGRDGCIYGSGPRADASSGRSATGDVTFIGPEFAGKYKWLRASTAPSGAIYGIPCHADRVLKIVPKTGEVALIGPSFPGNWKWHGGVLASDGCIYCVPQFAEQVLKIDTATDEISLFGGPFLGKNKWYGALLGCDGSVWCIPQNETAVLKIDPTSQLCSRVGDLPAGGHKWHGGVVGDDGASTNSEQRGVRASHRPADAARRHD